MSGILDTVHALLPEIRARAEECERARRLPADLAQTLARAGLFRLALPKEIGGLELDPATLLRVFEEFGAADASVGWCVMIANTTGLTAAYLERGLAQDIFGPPDAIAGGVFAPLGKAVVDGAAYRVTGRWSWASGSANCTTLMGGCVILEDGTPKLLPNGMPDSRMMIFPASDVELIDSWHVAGLQGTGSGDMAVHDVVVPKHRSVSIMTDRPRLGGALYAFPIFGLLALGVASVMLGNARAALEALVELAGAKTPQGSRRTLAERGSAQTTLAQAHAQYRAARAFLHDAVAQAWSGAQSRDGLSAAERAGLRLAATHAGRTASDIARAMYDLGGGSSVFLTSPLQRRFRDAHAGTQHAMISASTYEIAGRVLMGLPTDMSQF
jgi:alkylation response protein AidB-like acyl-CoA dehydrogenase